MVFRSKTAKVKLNVNIQYVLCINYGFDLSDPIYNPTIGKSYICHCRRQIVTEMYPITNGSGYDPLKKPPHRAARNVCMGRSGLLTHFGLVTPYGDRSGWTLAQVMTCCLTAPSHYLHQCWLIIRSLVTFIFGQFHKRCINRQWLKSVWKWHFIQISQVLMS